MMAFIQYRTVRYVGIILDVFNFDIILRYNNQLKKFCEMMVDSQTAEVENIK